MKTPLHLLILQCFSLTFEPSGSKDPFDQMQTSAISFPSNSAIYQDLEKLNAVPLQLLHHLKRPYPGLDFADMGFPEQEHA